MPMYQYQCGNCGDSFNKIMRISEMNLPTETACSKCGELNVEKVIGAPSYLGDQAKLPSDFKELMREMKKNVPGNNLKDYI